MLVALGMILCQIPQTVAASEDVTAAGEAVPVVETVEAAQAAEEAEIPSEHEEQYAEAGTAAAEVAAQTDGESGTTESNDAHEPSGNVEEARDGKDRDAENVGGGKCRVSWRTQVGVRPYAC